MSKLSKSRAVIVGACAGVALAGCTVAVVSDSASETAIATSFAQTFAVDADPLGRPLGLEPEPRTSFEEALVADLEDTALFRADEIIRPAYQNARGVRLNSGSAVLENIGIWGRKVGISLDGTEQVLIKNFAFTHRRSTDPYGSGIYVGEKTGSTGVTYISNAFIDLAEPGPNNDYTIANNEAIAVGRDSAPVRMRRATLLGAEDAALDIKSTIEVDASFLASGHRTLRIWGGAEVTLANTTILAFPGYSAVWFGEGPSRLNLYNCRFGVVGDDVSELTPYPPEWMINRQDGAEAEIVQLETDPFERDGDSFWAPASAPTVAGYLGGSDAS